MIKVKMLKTLTGYNLSGYGSDFLSADKGEVVELEDPHANRLIKSDLAIYSTNKVSEIKKDSDPGPDSDPNSDEGDGDKDFMLTKETISYIRDLDKDTIENILKEYGTDIDKRKSMMSIHKTMIETVGGSLPDKTPATDDGVAYMIKFFNDNFKIALNKDFYKNANDLSRMVEDVDTILTQALKDEDS